MHSICAQGSAVCVNLERALRFRTAVSAHNGFFSLGKWPSLDVDRQRASGKAERKGEREKERGWEERKVNLFKKSFKKALHYL